MMKARKRIALLLVMILMAAAIPVEMASAAGLTVTADRLNMRAEANTSSRAVAVVEAGDALEFVSESGDWYQVRHADKSGYVMKSYVSLNMDEIVEDIEANIAAYSAEGRTTDRVNLRSLPIAGADVVKVLGKDSGVKITGKCGAWYRATYGGKTGYLMAQYVAVQSESDAPAEETPGEPADGEYEAEMIGTATVRVNMREYPSTDADVVKVIGKGERVSVAGKDEGWYAVRSGGKAGYIAADYLRVEAAPEKEEEEAPAGSESAGSSQPAASGTLTARVNLRSEATTDSRALKVLSSGTKVTVSGEVGGFYQVMHDGQIGYISADYVKKEGQTDPGEDIYPATVSGLTMVTVNMRRQPEGKILHTLQKDTPVLLLGETGGWYKAAYEGEIGYIASAYVGERQEDADQPEKDGEGTAAYVNANSLNLRKGPGTGYGIVKVLRLGDEIECFEKKDGWYRVKAGEAEGYVSAQYVSAEKPEGSASIGKVILSDWFSGEVADVFDRGDVATVTDVRTGLSFQTKRTGGYNHADAQPLTSADTDVMHKIYGYKWQWTRRPIWVTVDGKIYAASMNGMPHGETDAIKGNDFDGCYCIHFLNSKTHGSDRVDSAHQSCVQEAYSASK